MSVSYNDDGYPIYSGGNGGYAENVKVDEISDNIDDAIEDLDLAKQNKLKFIHCSFSENYETSTIPITAGNYSEILEFDKSETNDENLETFELVDGELIINKSGWYLLNASLYFGLSILMSAGIYVYKNEAEILNEIFYGTTTTSSGKTIATKLVHLNADDVITVKGRNAMSSGASTANIYTKNIMTYLDAILITED